MGPLLRLRLLVQKGSCRQQSWNLHVRTLIPAEPLVSVFVTRTGAVGFTRNHCAVSWGFYGNPKVRGVSQGMCGTMKAILQRSERNIRWLRGKTDFGWFFEDGHLPFSRHKLGDHWDTVGGSRGPLTCMRM